MAYVAIQYADQQYPARSFSLLEKVKGKKVGEKKIDTQRERESARACVCIRACTREHTLAGRQAYAPGSKVYDAPPCCNRWVVGHVLRHPVPPRPVRAVPAVVGSSRVL